MANLTLLRKQIRAQRRAFSPREHRQASHKLVYQVIGLDCFANALHIAGYFAFDGEPDLAMLFEQVLALNKQLYLPIVGAQPHDLLLFAPYRLDATLELNRFGIPEPVVAKEQCLTACDLDLVLTPLVAFDVKGNRLGMGGGYYDRSFAFRVDPTHPVKPYLLGLAFESQKVADLPRQTWDVPLDGIVTESTVYRVK
ncbi:MAG: 5-formyltetrahydrofolate cyclo-ligase [Candidatus Competibacteraceae bacterium]|nr:5-formyltetrahydrofolate cyclo-ligase [Candidatus Competibacteraceae bacterium]